jgi:hypothetical protein
MQSPDVNTLSGEPETQPNSKQHSTNHVLNESKLERFAFEGKELRNVVRGLTRVNQRT